MSGQAPQPARACNARRGMGVSAHTARARCRPVSGPEGLVHLPFVSSWIARVPKRPAGARERMAGTKPILRRAGKTDRRLRPGRGRLFSAFPAWPARPPCSRSLSFGRVLGKRALPYTTAAGHGWGWLAEAVLPSSPSADRPCALAAQEGAAVCRGGGGACPLLAVLLDYPRRSASVLPMNARLQTGPGARVPAPLETRVRMDCGSYRRTGR